MVRMQLKDGTAIEILPEEVEGLRNAGLLMEEEIQDKPVEQNEPKRENPPKKETGEPEQPGYKLPVLTQGERKARIRQAKKLYRQGYSQREIARQLGVSHTAVQKWFKKNKSNWQLLATS